MPDLSDSSGGLSNPVFFNFVYYILWKVRILILVLVLTEPQLIKHKVCEVIFKLSR